MEEIEGRRETVLGQVPSWIWDGETLPVPVEEIADTCYGLLVRDVEDMCAAPGLPGARARPDVLRPPAGRPGEIWVNAEEARQWPPRRRFTIGHELGHWVMHRSRAALALLPLDDRAARRAARAGRDPEIPDIEEEASVFAAALLMPAHLVRREYERDRDFDRLCELFNCSGAAMGRRLHAVI